MYLALCVWVYKFVASKQLLFKFIFAGIDNPKYDWIRPSDIFLGIYFCGCMPFIPFVSSAVIFFWCGMYWAILAFFTGIIGAPLIVKIIWKTSINLMLIGASKSEAE